MYICIMIIYICVFDKISHLSLFSCKVPSQSSLFTIVQYRNKDTLKDISFAILYRIQSPSRN